MKKVLISLVLATILAMPIVALAAEGPQECCKLRRAITIDAGTFAKDAVVGPSAVTECTIAGVTTAVSVPTANWGVVCFLNVFNGIIDWVFTILIILAVFFTILGAFRIITASGKSESVSEGKDYVLYAAIGLAVALVARALPGLVRMIGGF
jgi:hypothetical protein